MLFGQRGRERQRFQLFNSSSFGENDLLFKDVTDKLAVLADDMDVSQVLGLDYVALLKGLGHEGVCVCVCVVKCSNSFTIEQLFGLTEPMYVCRKLTGGQCCAMVLHQPCGAEEM